MQPDNPDHFGNTGTPVAFTRFFLKMRVKPHAAAASIGVALLVACSVAIYANSLSVPFTFDDMPDIRDNAHIRITSLTPQALWDAGFKSPAPARFVANISLAINYYVHGYQVAGYHIVNIAVHALAGIFWFLLLRLTFTTPALAGSVAHGDWLALAAALVWLVNPIQTQSVTYIVQRMNAMAAMFYLLALYLYARGRLGQLKTAGSRFKPPNDKAPVPLAPQGQNPAGQNRQPSTVNCQPFWYFIASAISGLLALGCKQNAATLPLVMAAYEWYFFQNLDRTWLKDKLKWLGLIGVVFGLLALVFVASNPVHLDDLTDYARGQFTLGQRLLTQLRVVLYYAGLFVYPHPSRLTLDYQYRLSESLIDPPSTLVAGAAIAALMVLAVIGAKRYRLLSFGIAWYFVHLAIESSVIPLALVFEHRAYLPTMGLSLIIVVLGQRLIRSRWALAPLALGLVVCCVWTVQRNRLWQDPVAFWQDNIAKAPDKWRPYSNLGRILFDRGDYQGALTQYAKAAQRWPEGASPHFNWGVCALHLDRLDEAIAHLGQAVAIDPNYRKAHEKLGEAMVKAGRFDRAVDHFKAAARLDPRDPAPHYNMGTLYLQLGLDTAAIARFRQTIALAANHAPAYANMGVALAHLGRLDEAMDAFDRALKIDPNLGQVRNNLEQTRALKRALAQRITELDTALRANPQDVGVLMALAAAYQQSGATGQAMAHYGRSLRVEPELDEALAALAGLHLLAGENDKALALYEKLLRHNPDNAVVLYNIACIHALAQRTGPALDFLGKAIAAGYDNSMSLKVDPDLESIRTQDAYQRLMEGR